MSLGTVLREARERKGLSVDEVAEQTRMIHQMVEEIENDDFHRIVAAIYGRGFIKLYAECVGIDAAPLVQEFNEVYSGFRRPGVKTREVKTPVEEPVAVPDTSSANLPHKPGKPKVRAVVLPPEEDPPAPVAPAKSTASAVAALFNDKKNKSKDSPELNVQSSGDILQGSEETVNIEEKPVFDEFRLEENKVEEVIPEVQKSEEPVEDPVSEDKIEESKAEPEGDSDLGELFEFNKREPEKENNPISSLHENEHAHAETVSSEEAPLKMPVITQAPSWDDKPLEDGVSGWYISGWHTWFAKNKILAESVAAGIVLLILILCAIPGKKTSKPKDQPVSAASVVAAASDSSESEIFTKNLIPPPDSYVE